jgi:hypothetical protein
MIDSVRGLLATDPESVYARGGDDQIPPHFAVTGEIATLLLQQGADLYLA